MADRTQTRALAGAFILSAGTLLAPGSQAHQQDEAAYTLTLSSYGAEAQLGSNTTGDIINTMDVELDRVRNAGKKILMWQGTADQLITDSNVLDYYIRVAANYGKGGVDRNLQNED